MENANDSLQNINSKETLVKLSRSADGLVRLLEDLLEWARLQIGSASVKKEVCNVRSVVQDCIDLFTIHAEEKQIEIENFIAPDLAAIIEQGALSTALRNLISNALKFTERGGRIEVSAFSRNHEIQITVKDSGNGMDFHKKNNLFSGDRSFSTQGTEGETGSGIGLFLTREVIAKASGDIRVVSEEKKGSAFTIILPDDYEQNPT